MIHGWITVCIGAMVAAPLGAQGYKPLPRALASLSPTEIAQRVEVTDDPLDHAVVLSTERAYRRGQAMAGAYADDVHLRARIDRVTGAVSWEVWHRIINFGAKGKVTAVTYAAAQGPVTVIPKRAEQWEDMCGPGDSHAPCHQYLLVVFEVPQEVIAGIASSYRPGDRQPWRVRFDGPSANGLIGGVAPVEAAGLMLALANRQT